MFGKNWLRSFSATLLLCAAWPLAALAQPAPTVCDVDADGDIDKVDIRLIADARGRAASGPTDPRDPDRDLKITSADARTCTLRCSLAQCAAPSNRPPIADAGRDQSVFTGVQVTLDGSDSTDADGDPLTFRWTVKRKPAGSAITLAGATTVSPTFRPDIDGEYEFQLIVNDRQVDSAPDTVVIATSNAAPIAHAGPDQDVIVSTRVQLDGSASSDINGDPLTFSWSFDSRPAGSNATLSGSTAVMPSFTTDVAGVYRLRLVVNDGKVNSQPDFVEIETGAQPNIAPIANAGIDQAVDLGATVQLDGSASSDPDSGPSPLTYAWSLIARPAGSTAVLSSASAIRPSFRADKAGEYVAQLIVNDGALSSAPDTVRISTRNTRPVAVAGDDQTGQVNTTISLDGRDSFDADGDPLTYQWSFTSRPAGSAATLANPQRPQAAFIPDQPGLYVVQLVVDDGQVASDPDTATITISVGNQNQLSIDDLSFAEGNGGARSVTFTVRRANPSGTSTVAFQTANGTATVADNDYVANSGTVTFGAGATTRPVGVSIVGDASVEPDETFFVNLSNPSANATILDGQAVGTIANDDAATLPLVSVTAIDPTATEAGPTSGTLRVNRTGALTNPLTVNVAIGGSATNGSDFQALVTSVTLAAGQPSVDITVSPVDDAAVEGSETVVMTLLAAATYTIGTPAAATVTIADNDALPTVTITATDATASETGPDPGVMRVSRTGATTSSLAVPTSANVGTATNNVDYQLVGQILIPAGAAFVDVTFTPIDDALVEGPETIIRTILGTANYIVGAANSATVTIADNDALPTVTITATDAVAAEAGANTGTMRIARSGGNNTLSLLVSTARGGTATNNTDYGNVASGITIPAGAAFVDVTFTPIDDALVEGTETITMTLNASAAYTIGAANSATVTITDNDSPTPPTVTITATDATAAEAGQSTGTFTLSRSGPTTSPLTVNLSIGGSAINGSDYQAIATSFTFPAGQSNGQLVVTPIDDALIEAPETVGVSIVAGAAYVIGAPSSGSVTITSNDVGATLEFDGSGLAFPVGENLQRATTVRISAGVAPAGGLPVTVRSSSADVLVSTNDKAAGQSSVAFTIAAGSNSGPTLYVQSLAGTGTAQLTVEVTSSDFGPGTPLNVRLAPAGFTLVCYVQGATSGTCNILGNRDRVTTAAETNPSQLYIEAQVLNLDNPTNNVLAAQDVRGGYTVNLPLTLSSAGLGAFRASSAGTPGNVITSLAIPGGEYYSYFYLDPNNASVSATGSIGFTRPAGAGIPTRNGAAYRQVMDVLVWDSSANLSLLPGTTAVASSEYSAAYTAALAINGVNSTNSSWCTANNDVAPKLTITFPSLLTVRQVTVLSAYSPSYDFLTGRFRVLNGTGGVIHDSGVVTVPNGQVVYDVPAGAQTAGAKSLEFTGVTWVSVEPCLSEVVVAGTTP